MESRHTRMDDTGPACVYMYKGCQSMRMCLEHAYDASGVIFRLCTQAEHRTHAQVVYAYLRKELKKLSLCHLTIQVAHIERSIGYSAGGCGCLGGFSRHGFSCSAFVSFFVLDVGGW